MPTSHVGPVRTANADRGLTTRDGLARTRSADDVPRTHADHVRMAREGGGARLSAGRAVTRPDDFAAPVANPGRAVAARTNGERAVRNPRPEPVACATRITDPAWNTNVRKVIRVASNDRRNPD